MKRVLAIILLATKISRCEGYYNSVNSDIKISDVPPDYQNHYGYHKKPLRAADKINPDGSEIYVMRNDTRWCGLTIWAIIPVPLWLPTCHDKTEVTFKNNKPSRIANQSKTSSAALCGPFVPIMGIDGGSKGFCRTEYRRASSSSCFHL